jgi:hypothetical protein
MKLLPPISLPRELCQLLCSNMNASVDSSAIIQNFINERPAFRFFIEEKFKEFDKKKRMDYIIQSLGWNGFRDRLANLYLHHILHHKFPHRTSTQHIQELGRLEQRISQYSVEGYSRGFLLAFYLLCVRLTQRKEDPSNQGPSELFSRKLIDLMKYSHTRIIKVDWVLLLLLHYEHFLGHESLKGALQVPNFSYQKLYEELTPGQRQTMNENLLTYAFSIHEADMFADELV